jgi:putative transposase
VGNARYTLACYRYIELNPVRARIVDDPAAYRWSSYRHNALGVIDPRVSEHRDYLRLGPTVEKCREVYRNLVAEQLDDAEMEALRAHTHQQRAFGSDSFRAKIEALTNRVAHVRPRGRPRSSLGVE